MTTDLPQDQFVCKSEKDEGAHLQLCDCQFASVSVPLRTARVNGADLDNVTLQERGPFRSAPLRHAESWILHNVDLVSGAKQAML